jgi:hypothetical protein
MALTPDWRHRLHQYARKGGKTSRRRTVDRIERFVAACGCRPEQIGRRHVYEFWESRAWAPSTARDYWYAIRLLWAMLERAGEPPRPPNGLTSSPP